MYTLLLVLGLLLLFIVISIIHERNSHYLSPWWIFVVIAGLIFIIQIISIPVSKSEDRSKMRQFEAVRSTIVTQRNNSRLTEFERVQLTQEIIKCNVWLATVQYEATSPWTDLFTDKSVLTLKPIE